MVGVFADFGIEHVPHFCPLHYLPFIARSSELLSKNRLRERGFDESHFRSKSKNSDQKRGFVDYAFLTLSKDPGIVRAKLKGGFPHLAILVPISSFNGISFDLCRYNVAMARRLPSNPSGGFDESKSNGRYYEDKQLPVARSVDDQRAMLAKHYVGGGMIEVLVPHRLELPHDTTIECYHRIDQELCESILRSCNSPWELRKVDPPGEYNRSDLYGEQVEAFVEQSMRNPQWLGNGLEFDRVSHGERKR